MATPEYAHIDPDDREAQWKALSAKMREEQALIQGSTVTPTSSAATAAASVAEPEVVGDVTDAEMAWLKKKYGNRLVKVTSVDPNDMTHGVAMHGHFYTALWEEFKRRDIEIEFDPSIIGLYHVNVSSMSDFPFDPEFSYVTLKLDEGVTSETERMLTERFGMKEVHFDDIRKGVEAYKQQLLDTATVREEANLKGMSIRIFGQIRPADIRIVEAYDSTARTTVYATSVRLPVGKGPAVMIDAVLNCIKHVLRAFIKKDPERAQTLTGIRMAWHHHTNNAVGIYAAEQDRKTPASTPLATQEATKAKADVEASLASALEATHLFDEPGVDEQAALQEIGTVAERAMAAMPAAAAMLLNQLGTPVLEMDTSKPHDGDIAPF